MFTSILRLLSAKNVSLLREELGSYLDFYKTECYRSDSKMYTYQEHVLLHSQSSTQPIAQYIICNNNISTNRNLMVTYFKKVTKIIECLVILWVEPV